MSDPYREQRPLLCDDYSDEEFHIRNYYQKRNQPSVCIGRARAHAKGAAAVLTRWPDNCSTSVAYWWLGVTMIAVTIFVIYNSVLIFGMIPAPNIKQPKYRTFNNGIKIKTQRYSLPEVYMHLIVNNDSDVQLNDYLPYINHLSAKYPNFKYKCLIVLNDTLKEVLDFNDDQRNEIAFNSLWENEKNAKKISNKYNISVEYMSLSTYLNDSPIKKFWRQLPPHLIPFLIRSVSIWEKGGIAFNPVILTPKSLNPNYVDKLYELFNKYVNSNNKHEETKTKTNKAYLRTNKKRPNNIQDIINALNADHNNMSQIDLNEADSKKITVVANTENSLHSNLNVKYNTQKNNNTNFNSKENITKGDDINSNGNVDIPDTANYTYTTDNILPLFIKYLFHTKPDKELITKSELKNVLIPKTEEVAFDDIISYNGDESVTTSKLPNRSEQRDGYINRVNITKKSDNRVPEDIITLSKTNKYDNIPELTVDIKGNIVASKTACHAFLGTMFSNVIHHTEEETLTDFIISELSLFCNGLLRSCSGVNVILV